MNKMLQSEIDAARRNAASISSGWSCTLLAYVEMLEIDRDEWKKEAMRLAAIIVKEAGE
jgi:hypothetical protein